MVRAQGRTGRWPWSSIAGGLCGVLLGAFACNPPTLPLPPAEVSGVGGAGGAVDTVLPQSLLPDQNGWVDRGATGSTNIQGQWYAYADGIGLDGSTASGACELAGHPVSDCSQVTTPQPRRFPNVAGKMCTAGIAARVVPGPSTGSTPDYSNILGAGIALDFDDASMATAEMAMPYDALANGVQGIAFDIDAIPLIGLRVEFPTATTTVDPAFWGGDQMSSPVFPGHNEVRWPFVTGPFYLVAPPAFDPTTMLGIRFHVQSSAVAAVSYTFCVSNLTVLYR